MNSTLAIRIAPRSGQIRAYLFVAVATSAWLMHGRAAAHSPPGASATTRYHIVPLSDDRLAFGARINPKGQVSFTDLFGAEPGVYRARFFDGRRVYTIGTFGGNNSLALALNRHGQVTGYADTAIPAQVGLPHAFRWSKGARLIDLGPSPLSTSYGADINDSAYIAGAAVFGPPGSAVHAARWTAQNRAQDLGTLAGGSSAAAAINESGTVAGWTQAPQDPALRVPFRWTPGRGMQALGTLASTGATASDINCDGFIAGTAPLQHNASEHAFLWSPQGGITDLGTGSGTASGATRLNNRGMVIGYISNLPAFGIGFVWTRTDGLIEFGKLGVNASIAEDLNMHGQVVGALDGNAFVWTRDQGMRDLNTRVVNAPTGLLLLRATAINDGGDIVAATNTGLVLLSGQAIPHQRPLVGPIRITGATEAGAVLTFAASFTDVDRQETHKAVWNWGDGNKERATLNEHGGVGNVNAQHRYTAAGEYIVRLTVTDSSGKSTTVRWDLVIAESGARMVPGKTR